MTHSSVGFDPTGSDITRSDSEVLVSGVNALSSEIDGLDPPQPEIIELSTGTKVRVLPLKMRQLFRLLRIVTRGGSSYLPLLRDALTLAGDDDAAEVFGTQLLAIALIALPEAEDEAVEFVQSVVEPYDLTTRRDKQAKEHNDSLRNTLNAELYNPDPGDLVTILEAVIAREKGDLVALGKRLGAMFRVQPPAAANKTDLNGETLPASSEPTPLSSGPSLAPSTSSPPSMDGPTPSFSTFPSVE